MRRLLQLYFPCTAPDNLDAAQAIVGDFYRCGEKAARKDTKKSPAYAFHTDAAAIIAEFQREYGIDLLNQRMHWWRFHALLTGLLAHSFSERVRYRVADPESIKSSELKKEYRKYKEMYALSENGDPVERPETLEAYDDWLLRIARGEAR